MCALPPRAVSARPAFCGCQSRGPWVWAFGEADAEHAFLPILRARD